MLFNIIKDIFPNHIVEYNYTGFEFLRNSVSKRKQSIDIFVHNEDFSFGLAIEYDGEQHFKPICFNNVGKTKAQNMLEYNRRMDEIKSYKISRFGKNNGICAFIRFNYLEKISLEFVVKKLIAYEII